jgi:hypothetical protein
MTVVFEFTGDSVADVHASMIAALPPSTPTDFIAEMDFQSLMLRVGERAEAEGYDMEVWKKGSRPEPELAPSEKKKEEARAKLRGELVASLAEGVHATASVKEEIKQEFEAGTEDKPATPKQPAKKAKGNGKPETDEQRKQRIIVQLQEMYTAGRKADVNKLLSEYGDGTRTFSAIPAEKFKAIESALETL